jgi:hypothetical protein
VRLGCGGCLTIISAALAAAIVVAALAWGGTRALQRPDGRPVAFGPEDGARAQQKIFDLARRGARAGSVALTEAEVNAFVARHIDPNDLPMSEPNIRLLGDDGLQVVGRVSVRRLLEESPLAVVARSLPGQWREQTVWLTVVLKARMEMGPRRTLRLEPRRFAVGRQWLPVIILRLFADPASLRYTRIGLPGDASDVRVEQGRVVIVLAPSARERI